MTAYSQGGAPAWWGVNSCSNILCQQCCKRLGRVPCLWSRASRPVIPQPPPLRLHCFPCLACSKRLSAGGFHQVAAAMAECSKNTDASLFVIAAVMWSRGHPWVLSPGSTSCCRWHTTCLCKRNVSPASALSIICDGLFDAIAGLHNESRQAAQLALDCGAQLLQNTPCTTDAMGNKHFAGWRTGNTSPLLSFSAGDFYASLTAAKLVVNIVRGGQGPTYQAGDVQVWLQLSRRRT